MYSPQINDWGTLRLRNYQMLSVTVVRFELGTSQSTLSQYVNLQDFGCTRSLMRNMGGGGG